MITSIASAARKERGGMPAWSRCASTLPQLSRLIVREQARCVRHQSGKRPVFPCASDRIPYVSCTVACTPR